MLKDGVVQIGEHRIDVTRFAEATLLNMGIGAVESSRNGEYVSYVLREAHVEGAPCALRLYFQSGNLTRISLSLDRQFGPYWNDKVWDKSFLFMEEEVYAEWLSKVLGRPGPVKSAEFSWGEVGVSVDHQKGWSTSIYIVPNRQQ